MLDFWQIEDKVRELLEPMRETHGVRTLQTYSGEANVEDILLNAGFVCDIPAVLISVEGFDVVDPAQAFQENYDVKIYIMDTNPRVERMMIGDSEGVGVYRLIKGVRELLKRKPTHKIPLLCTGGKKLFHSKNWNACLYAISYQIPMR